MMAAGGRTGSGVRSRGREEGLVAVREADVGNTSHGRKWVDFLGYIRARQGFALVAEVWVSLTSMMRDPCGAIFGSPNGAGRSGTQLQKLTR